MIKKVLLIFGLVAKLPLDVFATVKRGTPMALQSHAGNSADLRLLIHNPFFTTAIIAAAVTVVAILVMVGRKLWRDRGSDKDAWMSMGIDHTGQEYQESHPREVSAAARALGPEKPK